MNSMKQLIIAAFALETSIKPLCFLKASLFCRFILKPFINQSTDFLPLCLTLLLREFSINTTNLEMISISSCASWLLLWTKKRKNKNNTRRTVTFKQVLEIRIDKHCYNWMVSKICKIITCVWHMTRITLQYFFMVLKSFSITLLPSSSAQRLEALEKAFFLDLHLYVQNNTTAVLIIMQVLY